MNARRLPPFDKKGFGRTRKTSRPDLFRTRLFMLQSPLHRLETDMTCQHFKITEVQAFPPCHRVNATSSITKNCPDLLFPINPGSLSIDVNIIIQPTYKLGNQPAGMHLRHKLLSCCGSPCAGLHQSAERNPAYRWSLPLSAKLSSPFQRQAYK